MSPRTKGEPPASLRNSVARGLISSLTAGGIALGAGLSLYGGLRSEWLILVIGVALFVGSFGFWGASSSPKAHGASFWSTERHVRSLLALFVVIGGGVTIVAVRFLMKDEIGSGFITAVITMMSGVLGWYFGNKGVENAEKRVKEVQDEAQDAIVNSKIIQEHAPEVEQSAKAYETIVQALATQPALRDKVAEAIDTYQKAQEARRKAKESAGTTGGTT